MAAKHRHRIRLALFGQLMAAFEYMFKDFLAQCVDIADVLDEQIRQQKWVNLEVEQILSQKVSQSSIGSLLLHPTMGWHDPDVVNSRFKSLLERCPIANGEIPTLRTLWVIRHSVAHNAGVITGPDAARIGVSSVAGRVVDTDETFVEKTFKFLTPIAERLADGAGDALLRMWFRSVIPTGQDFERDREKYERLKWLTECVQSRPTGLTSATAQMYEADWVRVVNA